jgi:hypothetical protein
MSEFSDEEFVPEEGDEFQEEEMSSEEEGGDSGELSVEEEAELMGWREGGRLSAEDFLSKRETHLGLMKSNYETLKTKYEELNATTNEVASFLKKAKTEARNEGYQQALEEARKKQEEAFADGDAAAWKEAQQREKEIEEEMKSGSSDEKDEQVSAKREAGMKLLKAFQEDNTELFDDFQLSQTFQQAVQFYANKGMLGADLLEKAKTETYKKHKKGSLPNGGTGGSKGGGSVRGFESLPASAKKAFERFARNDPTMTKEKYLKTYNEA